VFVYHISSTLDDSWLRYRVVGLESWTWTEVGLESDFLRTWTGLGLEGQGLGLGLGLEG